MVKGCRGESGSGRGALSGSARGMRAIEAEEVLLSGLMQSPYREIVTVELGKVGGKGQGSDWQRAPMATWRRAQTRSPNAAEFMSEEEHCQEGS
jgi:hypothetical protein